MKGILKGLQLFHTLEPIQKCFIHEGQENMLFELVFQPQGKLETKAKNLSMCHQFLQMYKGEKVNKMKQAGRLIHKKLHALTSLTYIYLFLFC